MGKQSLVNKIKSDSIEAIKNKETSKLSTLRLLIAELEKEKVAHKLTEVTGLSDAQAEVVIGRQIKKLGKEIEAYEAVGRSTEAQEAEKELLLTYLPKQMTHDEILAEVKVAIEMLREDKIKNHMQYLSKLKGKADMGLVSRIALEELKKATDELNK